jgi:predicted amidohydrolase
MIARAQAEAGAKLILTPSATDTMQGYWRVRIGAQARAMENQCFVVQSPSVGMAPWLPCMDENFGAAGAFGPPDGAMPDDGVIALGQANGPAWVVADIDLAMVDQLRADGTVLPFRHWPEQHVPFHIIQNGAGSDVIAQMASDAARDDAPAAPQIEDQEIAE